MGADELIDTIRRDLSLEDADVALLALPSADASVAGQLVEAGRERPALATLEGHLDPTRLARLRDACWPGVHFMTVYRVESDGSVTWRQSGSGGVLEAARGDRPLTVIHTATYEDALGPSNTRIKFDLRASAWNGDPGSPTYGHFRWMRRLIAQIARPERGQRVLDAGCGTGWVGIEAARMGAMVSAFDLSGEMVKLALANAEQTGVDLDARVGFVEQVPFDRPFAVVLNSGVISFAPDPDVYLETLDRMVEPGGLLAIGDINPESAGFSRRRRSNPLLPARELNGLPRGRMAELLQQRGYTIEEAWYYQLTFPIPELMAVSEKKLKGLGCGLMLALNKGAARLDHGLGSKGRRRFDSWILRARKSGDAPS